MESMIKDEKYKVELAGHIYERLYTRYLKMFDYNNSATAFYEKDGKRMEQNIFNVEYKNGFLQLASCSLLIETIAGFMTGENETPKGQSSIHFNKVFEYAGTKGNELKKFKDTDFYSNIRCGILHQGETKGKYTVTRRSSTIKNGDEINSFRFHKALKELLQEYRKDLESKDWNDDMWKSCRQKIQYIIDNGK